MVDNLAEAKQEMKEKNRIYQVYGMYLVIPIGMIILLLLGFMEIEIKNYGTVLLGLTIYAHVQVRKLDLVTKRKAVGPILIYAANILGLIMAIAMIPAMLNGSGEELTLVMVGLVVLPIQIIAIVFFFLAAKDIQKAYPNMKEEVEDARKRYKEIKDRN
ncbi:hypothetical protein [Enterococcus faecalis]|uniref:Uncharacterized protein n=1 Tax=Enterococcus faecalis RP2S-4 TaxID=1244145 RepID=A0ABC9TN02_ENTFL|nr:hypothetical protein [Enterococcus faecalis]EPI11687.1 hypothetical protein D358_00219 [Enterococcus faecalis RP2S-4]